MIALLLTGCENAILGPDPGKNAPASFNVLWKTLDEKYGLFPVTDVDWDSLYTVYSDQVNESTGDDELWQICCSLLSHLENGHLTLQDGRNYYSADSPDPAILNGFKVDVVKNQYLSGFTITGEKNITYGRIKNAPLGYICIHSFGGAPNGRDWIRDLNDVLSYMQDCDGLIIDVRNNGGGFTRNVMHAGSLFIDRDITYYYSSQKTGPGHYDFGPKIAKTISPASDHIGNRKKIVVLTNRFTASGAEAFTLISRNLPYSTHIGDTTMGALGEVTHIAQMPNGWILYYPCTLTTLADGSSPEGIGIAPDILVNNTPANIQDGKDKAVELAIEHLMEKK